MMGMGQAVSLFEYQRLATAFNEMQARVLELEAQLEEKPEVKDVAACEDCDTLRKEIEKLTAELELATAPAVVPNKKSKVKKFEE